jgi:adenine-specific DNA-methyltransferase
VIRGRYAGGGNSVAMNKMESSREKVRRLLRELFQFDAQDLDFGIYRILNFRRKEIERFIEEDLIRAVEAEFKEYAKAGMVELQKEVERLKAEIVRDFGEGTIDEQGHVRKHEDAPKIKEYLRKVEELKSAEISEAQMNEVFNHVYEFFSRYYDKGDFISKRRYGGKEKYYVPYNGEEVVLHWANRDQYYVKTAEYFRNYHFKAGGYRVNFLLREAEVEVNNVVGENKYFVLCGSDFVKVDEEKKTVDVYFEWRALSDDEKRKFGTRNIQEALVVDAIDRIFSEVSGSRVGAEFRVKVDEERTFLEKYLNDYVRRNTTDYFVHKNLKAFLERELEFYIKNEVVDLDELENLDERSLRIAKAKVKAIRGISQKIIEFLAQIEDFQKMLFEKKKLVIRTDYCITLNHVDEKYYPEILKNKEQLEEWKKLHGFDIKEAVKKLKETLKGHRGGIDEIEVLKINPMLMIDTKFFDVDFKLKILEDAEVSDQKINGVLIRSENFQALNLLGAKYEKRIKCVHIDPPYNTATSGFLYKNNYQHSSWLSMMSDRIKLGINLLQPDGSFLCHIDENEYEKLHLLFENFSIPDAGTIVWDKRNPMNAGRGVATQHEYIICRSGLNKPIYLGNSNVNTMLDVAAAIIKKNGGVTEKAKKEYAKWVSDNDQLSGGEKAYRYLDDEGRVYQSVSLRAPEPRSDPKFFKPLIHPITMKPCVVPPNGFSRTPENLNEMVKNGEILFGPDETTQPRQKVLLTKGSQRQISSVIQDAHKGKADLSLLGLDFPYCHPVTLYQELLGAMANDPSDIVIDFFAGSGTTGHAVINQNALDGGKRKYILIEMADCFDTIMKPRLEKVIFSKHRQRGLPDSDDSSGHIFKYLYLEQYEDTLNNIVFLEKGKSVQETLDEFGDYLLKNVLEFETRGSPTRLNMEQFQQPFDYKIWVTTAGEKRLVTVDLVETFNYLLGIAMEKFRGFKNQEREYRCIFGKLKQENIAIIWRNTHNIDLKRDKEFIENTILAGTKPDRIFINGDTLIEKAEPIEPEFKRLMGA